MLIGNIQSMKSPQIAVSRLIRFRGADVLNSFCSHAIDLSIEDRFLLCSVWHILKNRESSGVCDFPTISVNESTHEMIEGTSEVLYNVPSHQTNVVGNVFSLRCVIEMFSGLRVLFFSDQIGLSVDKFFEGSMQFTSALGRPVNF